MKSKRIVSLLVAAGLLAAVSALAATAAKKAPPQDVKDVRKEVVRVEVRDGDEEAVSGWEDDGLFALGDEDFGWTEAGDDEDGADVRRYVIRRGPGAGRGPGMGLHGGMGRGMGAGMGRGPGRGMGLHRGMGFGPGMFARLDLTDTQREKLADLHERQQRKAIQARADMQIARMDLHKLMQADAPSATAIHAQIDKLTRMQSDMRKSHVSTFLEARALLTPEQQKQLKASRGPGGRGFGPGQGAGPQVRKQLRLHQPPAGGTPKSD